MPQLVAEEAGQGGDTPSASEDNGSFVEPEWLKKSKANGKNMNLFKTIGEQKCKFFHLLLVSSAFHVRKTDSVCVALPGVHRGPASMPSIW